MSEAGVGRRFSIPLKNLPPGFIATLETPPERPVDPHPAATVVVLRRAPRGLEVLLLQRVRSAGFVPGAWVFPGGRVDAHDAGSTEADAAMAGHIAALRELFEETGLLLARRSRQPVTRSSAGDDTLAAARATLLTEASGFASALAALQLEADVGRLAQFARWVTPEIEPRRFDTQFFATVVDRDVPVEIHRHEASEARWLTPAEALVAHDAGRLPMVFPTIHTLELLAGFRDPDEAWSSMASRPPLLCRPRLVVDGDRVHMVESTIRQAT